MEANIVIKAEDLTPDFADGICKVFSKNATLHIKVEYELSGESAPAAKRKGPKPKAVAKAYTGKKRGPKPAGESKDVPQPKKRGPKPKNAA